MSLSLGTAWQPDLWHLVFDVLPLTIGDIEPEGLRHRVHQHFHTALYVVRRHLPPHLVQEVVPVHLLRYPRPSSDVLPRHTAVVHGLDPGRLAPDVQPTGLPRKPPH